MPRHGLPQERWRWRWGRIWFTVQETSTAFSIVLAGRSQRLHWSEARPRVKMSTSLSLPCGHTIEAHQRAPRHRAVGSVASRPQSCRSRCILRVSRRQRHSLPSCMKALRATRMMQGPTARRPAPEGDRISNIIDGGIGMAMPERYGNECTPVSVN